MDEKSIFFDALDREPGTDRVAFVKVACGGVEEAERRVWQLLQAHEEASEVLDQPAHRANELAQWVLPDDERIGPYEVLEPLGEGGMGIVYHARQQEPVQRDVALKLIKPGMDSAQIVARFEAERQALAVMDHPNIARVFDAGSTDSGRPYFVMELVDGISITDYCDAKRLSVEQRLLLFRSVCNAVHHAHQKGIVHRDLKPSNVLVSIRDGRPTIKVIDFGVAKAIVVSAPPVWETDIQQIVGTPLYMSPEQARTDGQDVDTRTDIYSLGVMLYELMTGTTPFEKEELQRVGNNEVRRFIREVDPPKPSDRFSSLGARLSTVSENRKIAPQKLSQTLRGDLDWIIVKAIDKERDRRYDSAAALGIDVERYLAGSPVSARRPSMLYYTAKFVSRNRAVVAMSCLLVFGLIAATSVSTWFAVRTNTALHDAEQAQLGEKRQREVAEESQQESERARKVAVAAQNQAEEKAAISRAVTAFLQHDLLANASPSNEPDRDIRLRTVIDRAAKRIEKRFAKQPLVEAAIRETIGKMHADLGEYDEAIKHLERTYLLRTKHLDIGDSQILDTAFPLTNAYLAVGRKQDADDLFDQLLTDVRQEYGENDEHTMWVLQWRGWAYAESDQCEKALPLLEKAHELRKQYYGMGHRSTLGITNLLPIVYTRLGMYEEARALFAESHEHREQAGVTDLDHKAATLFHMGELAMAEGKFDEANQLLLESADLRTKLGGNGQHITGVYLARIGQNYLQQRKKSDAREVFEKSVELLRDTVGLRHTSTMSAAWQLSEIYMQDGDNDLAIALLEQIRPENRVWKLEQSAEQECAVRLPRAYLQAGEIALANDRIMGLVDRADEFDAGIFQQVPKLAATIGKKSWDIGLLIDSKNLHQGLLRWQAANLTDQHPSTILTLERLSMQYAMQNRWEESLDLCERLVTALDQGDFEIKHRAYGLMGKGICLANLKKLKQAELAVRESIKISEEYLPESIVLLQGRAVLGEVLTRQEKFDDAEKLLLRTWEQLDENNSDQRDATRTRLVRRLVTLYMQRGEPDTAERWRKHLE